MISDSGPERELSVDRRLRTRRGRLPGDRDRDDPEPDELEEPEDPDEPDDPEESSDAGRSDPLPRHPTSPSLATRSSARTLPLPCQRLGASSSSSLLSTTTSASALPASAAGSLLRSSSTPPAPTTHSLSPGCLRRKSSTAPSALSPASPSSLPPHPTIGHAAGTLSRSVCCSTAARSKHARCRHCAVRPG
ncbi:hypothetical protein DFJ74DRAFT_659350 [Hyaloraphidium curvatum]|nr:hypothetical protein DFJ74DRAFT_659350 [Hyaloraphidium curvatum]